MRQFASLFYVSMTLIFFKYQGASALNCRVCSQGGLDEFGECEHAFDYNCDDYARRVSADQRVYCRTTRQRARNGTYTISKLCITDMAHYADFPRAKTALLDEECDVADVDGAEVAYCLCRTGDYCNAAPIADQFTDFENKYPEFFEPIDSGVDVGKNIGSDSERRNFPLPAFRKEMGAQPSLDELLNDLGQSLTSADAVIQRPKPIAPVSAFSTSVPTTKTPQPIVPIGGFGTSGSAGGVAMSANTFTNVSPHQIPFPFTASPASMPPIKGSSLSCLQCSEANLASESADCASQIPVDCPASSATTLGRPVCFSRQIITPKGEYGVEKMCVPEKAVMEEFGDDAILDGCATIDIGTVVSRYCVCSTSNCNRASITRQMELEKTTTISDITKSTTAMTAGNRHALAATKSTTFAPTSSSTSADGALRCVTCLDAELRNSLADCKRKTQQNCRVAPGDRAYCLTRQTQNGKDSFIVEKSCTTRAAFLENFPEERKFVETGSGSDMSMASRCASTYDGYVNFCICDSDLCNEGALTQQAEQLRAHRPPTPPLSTLDVGRFGSEDAAIVSDSGRFEINSGIFSSFQHQHQTSGRLTTMVTATSASVARNNQRQDSTRASFDSSFGDDIADVGGMFAPTSATVAGTSVQSRISPPPRSDSERLSRWKETMTHASAGVSSVASDVFIVTTLGALVLPIFMLSVRWL